MFQWFQELPNQQKVLLVIGVLALLWFWFYQGRDMMDGMAGDEAEAMAEAEAEAIMAAEEVESAEESMGSGSANGDKGYLGLRTYPPAGNPLSEKRGTFTREYGVGGNVEASDPAMVMWFARWCGHCQNTKPMWDLFTSKYDGIYGIRFASIDGDKEPNMTAEHGVNAYPTIKFYPDGIENPSSSVVYQGDMSVPELERFMKGYVKKWRLHYYK